MDFSSSVLIIFVVAILYVIFKAHKEPKKAEKLAQTAVIIGILGTFVGVFIGLMNFDTSSIDTSIEDFLKGLKTAFITSILGQISSIWINWRVKQPKTEQGTPAEEIDMADLLRAMQAIEKGIVGDGETTLITQIQKLRTTNHDDLTELNTSFKDFAGEMAENNSKALIEALEGVMRDFNTKINEQFGDNFKQLNQAVGELLVWQKQYKEFVENSAKDLRSTIDIVNSAVSSIHQNNEEISKMMREIEIFKQSADALQAMVAKNIGTVENLAQIAERSKNLFPQLETNLKRITENVNELIGNSSREIEHQSTQVTSLYTDMQDKIHTLVKQTADTLEEQIVRLDKELGDELNKALQTMGSQLYSLSSKFVSDYTPLTDKLQRLIDMSRKVN